jgi:hypothetical protein
MTTTNSQQKNFLASLFDFGFTSFVTLRFLKVIYAIFVVLILLGGLFLLIGGLSTGNALGIIGAIIFAPLVTLVYLVFARIMFEVIAMFFRIGDNTFLAVQLLGGRGGQWGQGPQPGYGPPAPYGSQPVANAPWGYPTGGSETAGAPTGTPYGSAAPQANYGQPQGNYAQPQSNYAQPQGNYAQPQDGSGGQYTRPSETPSSEPGQQGWEPEQKPPTQ